MTALPDILGPILVRIAAVIDKADVSDRLAIVAEKHAASLALAFPDFQVTGAAQRVDQIGEDLLAFCNALLRHQGIGPLRRCAGSKHQGHTKN